MAKDLNKLPIPFPAANDFGARPASKYPTLAVVFHMAEGTDVAQYLAGKPKRNVSVHYTIEQKTATWKDGQIVRCLPERRISGSINPSTLRADNDPLFGAKHAKAVLGTWHWNPNVVVISVEVAGKAVDGPTKAQRDAMVALFDDIRRRHPDVVPLGHRDFQNVKRCPGTTTRIKAAFEKMGGHGKNYKKPDKKKKEAINPEIAKATRRGYNDALDDAEAAIQELR